MGDRDTLMSDFQCPKCGGEFVEVRSFETMEIGFTCRKCGWGKVVNPFIKEIEI